MEQQFFYASSVRLMRFLYALGFEKESCVASSGKENWRFLWSKELQVSLDFYREMRRKNNK